MHIRLNPYTIKLRDPLKHLFFSILFLIIGGLIPAYAQAAIDESMSGSWYDPSHDGEGRGRERAAAKAHAGKEQAELTGDAVLPTKKGKQQGKATLDLSTSDRAEPTSLGKQ